MKTLLAAVTILLFTQSAHAQFGDLLNKAGKLKKGVSVALAATKDFTEEEEIEIGRVIAARILATYPLSKDETVQKYVTLVGNTVAAYSSRPTLDWHFAVLETDTVNAFSAPGGYLFITTGALELIQSEAELAGVLGHEIAHATEKHILNEVRRAQTITEGLNAAQSELGTGGLTDDVARKIGDLAIEKLFTTGLGRKEELESDRIGADLARAAGYQSAAYLGFLESLAELSGKSSTLRQLGATHPGPDDRIKSLRPRLSSSEGVLLAERWQEWTGSSE
ncbi:MAG TPA: M48 family metalloprotease [Thermoanaerobaculia bacterium]|nr:M48 family metalloprotease [Thermoanaerobaculia bacterium]